jgi:hypothetical protein
MKSKLTALRSFLTSTPFLLILYFTLSPVLFYRTFWLWMWGAGRSNAWDGSAHSGIAEIYAQNIFPDTFGWTQSFFGGMPFPNFYPPLFYWCMGLLYNSHLVSFETGFKLMTAVPILLIPALMWLLGWVCSEKNNYCASWAGLLSFWLLTDPRSSGSTIWPSGLDYHSTFISGFYTQPLGFVLLIAWFIVYLKAQRSTWRFTLACLLLALTVLANFFNAVIASIMVLAVLGADVWTYFRATRTGERGEARRAFLAHFFAPLIAMCLTLVWVVPMLSTYRYFVTLPFEVLPLTPFLWGLYVVALIGMLGWLWRPTKGMGALIVTCLIMASMIVLTNTLAQRSFPLQSHRFLAALNFLLTVPAGYGLITLYRVVTYLPSRKAKDGAPSRLDRYAPYAFGTFLVVFLLAGIGFSMSPLLSSYTHLLKVTSFYPPPATVTEERLQQPDAQDLTLSREEKAPGNLSERGIRVQELVALEGALSLDKILRFGQEHRDGSYLVALELTQSKNSRAISQYLGAQGNQSLLAVFREDSPNSLFMYPQVNALSAEPDSFGISSALADDLDFMAQPLSKHLDRSRELGVRYLVIHSKELKERLAKEQGIGARHDLGTWSIFEIQPAPLPPVRALAYRPALVFTDFTLKKRRRNEHNFIRFAEEQFADGWFDVLLAYAPGAKIEDLQKTADASQFGALIVEKYDCDDCDAAYQRLRDFAQQRPLILLKSDAPLFRRVESGIADFPHAKVIESWTGDPGEWMQNTLEATFNYSQSPLRAEWTAIRSILENNKIPTGAPVVNGDIKQNSIRVDTTAAPASGGDVPVLIRTSFHPNWQRSDGGHLYIATPAFILTFVRQPVTIEFRRRLLDWLGLAISAVTLVGLIVFTVWQSRRRTPLFRDERLN